MKLPSITIFALIISITICGGLAMKGYSIRKKNDIQASAYFRLREFQSPDTKEVMIDPKVLECLDCVQRASTTRIIITSGYRTPEHNKKIGGALKSYHMKGMAVDCYQQEHYEPASMKKLAERGLECGFTTAIIYKGHVHLDVRYYGLGLRYAK